MNIQEYIASGILESYVLGELTSAEEQAVEDMARQYPEIREELQKIEETLELAAFRTSVKAPAGAREQLMASLETSPAKKEKVIPIDRKRNEPVFYRYVAAASVVIALFSSFLAYNYWSNWKQAEEELTTLIAQNQQIAEDYNQVNQELDVLAREVAILNDSSFVRIPLSGTENSPESYATVYWNGKSEQVYLNIQSLAKLSRDQQYQLWAIIDGKPVDAGVFDVKEGLFRLKDVGGTATAFAVTLEPAGGSQVPTLENMKVIGAVPGT